MKIVRQQQGWRDLNAVEKGCVIALFLVGVLAFVGIRGGL